MKSLNYYLVDVDEELPFTREVNGVKIYSERAGGEYDTKPQEGVVDVPYSEGTVKKGETVIFDHSACDRRTESLGKVQYAVKPEQVFATRTGTDNYQSVNRIVARAVFREPKKTASGIFLEHSKQQIPSLYKVESSHSKDFKKGDLIYVTKFANYYIERLDRYFIKPELVIGIANKDHDVKKLTNTFSITDPIDERDEFEKSGFLWLKRKDKVDKSSATVIKSKYFVEGDNYIIRKRAAYEVTIRGKKYQAIRKHEFISKI